MSGEGGFIENSVKVFAQSLPLVLLEVLPCVVSLFIVFSKSSYVLVVENGAGLLKCKTD